MAKDHVVKSWPGFYEKHINGELPVMIRKDDRDYQPGDTVELKEYEPAVGGVGQYTGRTKKFHVNRTFRRIPGLEADYVLIAMRPHIER